MGIRISGLDDTISASDGSLNIEAGGPTTISDLNVGNVVGAAATFSSANFSDRLLVGTTSGNYDLEVQKSGNVNLIIGSTDASGAVLILDGDSNGDGVGNDYGYISHTSSGNLEYTNLKSGTHIFKGASSAERMRIDSSGNVSIDAADGKLNLTKTGLRQYQLQVTGGGTDDGLAIRDESGSTEIARFTRSGNVGINTTAPAYGLHVNSNATIQNNAFRVFDNALTAGLTIFPPGVSGNWTESTGFALASDAGTSPIGFLQGATEAMRIDSSGNVSVGSTTALTGSSSVDGLTFYGSGSIYASRSGSNNLFVGRQTGTAGNTVLINADGTANFTGTVNLNTASDYAITAYSNGDSLSNKATIYARNNTAGGRVWAGESAGGATTSEIFENGSATFAGEVTGNSGFNADRSNASFQCFTGRLSGGVTSYINASGDALISGTITSEGTYNTTTGSAANMYVHPTNYIFHRSTSSIKYKTNVETIEDQYSDALLNCRPVWYQSLCEADNSNFGHWGFIAEEVAEIDPRLVHYKEAEDGILEPEGVQYDRFVPHLLNLIKRQQQAIETLEAKVAALEAG